MLKDSPVPKGNFEHLTSCADLFTSLFPLLEGWEWELQGKFRPDRIAYIKGNKIYFEIDRGTEDYGRIEEKLQRYIDYYRETRETYFVVFTVQDYLDPFGKMRTSAKERGRRIIDCFDAKNLPGNFMVGMHDQLVRDPDSYVVSRFDKHTLGSLKAN